MAMAASRSSGLGNAMLSSLAYSFCSISMVLANKMIVSGYDFSAPYMLCFLQNLVAFLAVYLARGAGAIEAEEFNLHKMRLWLPVNIVFTLMLLTSFLSLGLLSVPMVTLFKNVTNVFIVAGDYYMFSRPVTGPTVASLSLMTMGALLAGWYDLSFSAAGYFWMMCNCFATAGYVLTMRQRMDVVKLSQFGMAYYNNGMSLPFLLLLSVVTGEAATVPHMQAFSMPSFWAVLTFSGTIGFGLSLASLWCVHATSPTTYSIVGSLNKVPVTVLGIIMFNVPVNAQSIAFIVLGLAGGFVYSYAMATESRPKAQPPASSSPPQLSHSQAQAQAQAQAQQQQQYQHAHASPLPTHASTTKAGLRSTELHPYKDGTHPERRPNSS